MASASGDALGQRNGSEAVRRVDVATGEQGRTADEDAEQAELTGGSVLSTLIHVSAFLIPQFLKNP